MQLFFAVSFLLNLLVCNCLLILLLPVMFTLLPASANFNRNPFAFANVPLLPAGFCLLLPAGFRLLPANRKPPSREPPDF
ncbi:hypothetical protein [Methanimicrococcus hongohii]|uniref:hypothetical protein n=1 Tax=Methanimicrococcus hongohii TaxID=3028295 RepID=UPI00292CC1F0|nr:hypothetical protein [Methanimicrococcus sp. Hf6]